MHIPKSPPTKDHPRFQSISSKTIPAFERINGLFTKQFFLSLQKTNKSEHFRHLLNKEETFYVRYAIMLFEIVLAYLSFKTIVGKIESSGTRLLSSGFSFRQLVGCLVRLVFSPEILRATMRPT